MVTMLLYIEVQLNLDIKVTHGMVNLTLIAR